jgi:hypothetical protein
MNPPPEQEENGEKKNHEPEELREWIGEPTSREGGVSKAPRRIATAGNRCSAVKLRAATIHST